MPKHSSYLSKITRSALPGTVKWLVQEARVLKFDAIAVRGCSGIVPGTIVAYLLRKPLIIVRKGETSHSDVGPAGAEILCDSLPLKFTYVVIDDTRATGATIKAIRTALSTKGTYLGTLLYSGQRFRAAREDEVP